MSEEPVTLHSASRENEVLVSCGTLKKKMFYHSRKGPGIYINFVCGERELM